jgi:hypothetical protein
VRLTNRSCQGPCLTTRQSSPWSWRPAGGPG